MSPGGCLAGRPGQNQFAVKFHAINGQINRQLELGKDAIEHQYSHTGRGFRGGGTGRGGFAARGDILGEIESPCLGREVPDRHPVMADGIEHGQIGHGDRQREHGTGLAGVHRLHHHLLQAGSQAAERDRGAGLVSQDPPGRPGLERRKEG